MIGKKKVVSREETGTLLQEILSELELVLPSVDNENEENDDEDS